MVIVLSALQKLEYAPPDRQRQKRRDCAYAHHERNQARVEAVLDGDDRAADRHQDLFEVLAIDGYDQHALEDITECAADDDRRRS